MSDLILVDGSGYIFRAFFAAPALVRSDGLPVNAIHAFTGMLWDLVRRQQSIDDLRMAIVFDKARKTFRNDIYPDYKAQRPPLPPDLAPQMPLIRDVVRAFELPCVEQAGYEADDLIATYARLAEAEGSNVTIVSSDKDLMQLVTHKVTMLDPIKNRRIGRLEVVEALGVPPEKVVDLQALMGDAVDNVPGVPGIGVKIAAALIAEYGSLEGVLAAAAAGVITQPKRRCALIDHAGDARLSQRLVRLDNAVPLDVPLDALHVHATDYGRLISFLKAMEFITLTQMVADFADMAVDSVEADANLCAKVPA